MSNHAGVENNRRMFLRSALAASTFLATARTAQPLAFGAGYKVDRTFAPVKVSRDRLIREVVGLRPYRAEGFVVDAERLGEKLLIHNFDLYDNEADFTSEMPGGNDLYPEHKVHRDAKRYFGAPYVHQYNTMLIEPSIYLNALLRDFYIAGGKLVVKEFRSREEIARLPEPVIFNCAGLGARAF